MPQSIQGTGLRPTAALAANGHLGLVRIKNLDTDARHGVAEPRRRHCQVARRDHRSEVFGVRLARASTVRGRSNWFRCRGDRRNRCDTIRGLELLKEIAPGTKRVAVMFNPQTAPFAQYYLRPIENMAPKLGVTTFPLPVGNDNDMESAIEELARGRDSGLIAMVDSFVLVHRKSIIELAARHQIPTVYADKNMTMEGGLIS
jgi:hypothetical protein